MAVKTPYMAGVADLLVYHVAFPRHGDSRIFLHRIKIAVKPWSTVMGAPLRVQPSPVLLLFCIGSHRAPRKLVKFLLVAGAAGFLQGIEVLTKRITPLVMP